MILIADDNEDVRRMMRKLIEEIETEPIEVSNGNDAIEAYEQHRPDWVLMDINMRTMDGLTAMRTILERHPKARIVIVSQYQDARTRETALGMGAHAFVGKEDLTELRQLIDERVVDSIASAE